MGFAFTPPCIIGIISSLIGLGVLIVSSLYLERNHRVDQAISAGVFGLFAGITQMFSIFCVWKENWSCWIHTHIAVFVFAIIAFSLDTDMGGREAFFALTLVSWLYCVLGGGAVCFLGKGK